MAPTVGVLEAAGSGGCLLTTGPDSLEAIAFHLAELGAEFTILEPPELITRSRVLAALLHRASAATPPPAAEVP